MVPLLPLVIISAVAVAASPVIVTVLLDAVAL